MNDEVYESIHNALSGHDYAFEDLAMMREPGNEIESIVFQFKGNNYELQVNEF